tara:strand:- start:120 stop:650 length:531 start_codon:yes stop_codon:yes gene_type:complete
MKNKFFLIILIMMPLSSKEIQISISKQELYLFESGQITKTYKISSSKYGEGSKANSFKTPLGKHEIKKLIGENEQLGMRFIGRVPTEIYPIYDSEKIYVSDDVVQSRIIWLAGMEEGINKGLGVDSFERYIYIHGTPEEWLLGKKASKGCIRMANSDVIELFGFLKGGETVHINKY